MTVNHLSLVCPRKIAALSILVGLFILFALPSVHAQTTCDNTHVTIDPTLITVEPNGSDDTTNIQCALDTAVNSNISTVRLSAGLFRIGGIVAENFKGTLEGKTRTTTQVVTIDGALDCPGLRDSGRLPAVFKLISGSPRIRYMTLTLGNPCSDGGAFYGMHFTGRSALDACGNDVIFGEVDRIDMIGPDPSANVFLSGMEVSGEGYRSGGCNVTLSGTFKVNRSTFSNLGRAIITSMRAASPVDIRFNSFDSTDVSVLLRDSNQDATVAFNDFTLSPYRQGFTHGILLETRAENPPSKTSVKVNGNVFTRSNDNNGSGYRSYQVTGPAQVNLQIIDNTFDFSGETRLGLGILSKDTNKGIVSGNRFMGEFEFAIKVENPSQSGFTDSWSITGNNFSGTDFVEFQSSVIDSVFGPGQPGAVVIDAGTGNFILP